MAMPILCDPPIAAIVFRLGSGDPLPGDVKTLNEAAERSGSPALFLICGAAAYFGVGMEKDKAEAFCLLKNARKKGSARIQSSAAEIYALEDQDFIREISECATKAAEDLL